MSPRVKPRARSVEFQRHLDEREDLRDAAADFARGKGEALESTLQRFGLPSSSTRGNGAYTDSDHSWFLDLAFATGGDRLLRDMPAPPIVGSPEEAWERLRSVQGGRERRDLSTTATAGGGFVPTNSAPSYVADSFGIAAHNAAVLSAALGTREIPPTGTTISTGRISTGASTTVAASENAAVQETDPVTATASSVVSTISGQVDVSEQLLDRSDPPIDEVISRELGALWGEDLDATVLNGTGSGQFSGLLQLAGTTAITATTASAVANFAACGKLTGDVAATFGGKPDALVMHPRRAAFIRSVIGYSPQWPTELVIEAPAMPTNIGGTQDAIVAMVLSNAILFTSQPAIRVMAEVGSGTLTVRISAYAYAALVVTQPASIGKATGAGLTTPGYTL